MTNEFLVNYEQESNNTFIAIETDTINQDDFITIKDGEFEVAYFQLIHHYDNPETPVEERFYVYLNNINFERTNPYSYGINSETEVLVIKDYEEGDYLSFESSFGFDNENYADQISLDFDVNSGQTVINLETDNYSKESIIFIDGDNVSNIQNVIPAMSVINKSSL